MKLKPGLILAILGFFLILLNAIDYLANWQNVPSGLTVIGLMFVVVGIALEKKEKKSNNLTQNQ